MISGDMPFQEPPTVLPVAAEDSLTVLIEAHDRPLRSDVFFFESVEGTPVQKITLGRNLTASFVADLPVGLYIIHISSQWPEGDLYYAFKIEVK